ncbi:MAG: hypothetical protein ACTSSH_04590 [Candidatus Heimdallarchaeota archaeon]
MTHVTPDMLKSKIVYDSNGIKIGKIAKVVRERYRRITVDFLEIEFDKRINIGPKDFVKVRTKDANMQPDGNIKVNFTKEQLKVMKKEQDLQKHPPTI